MSVSEPFANAPAAIVKDAIPPDSACCAVYVPLVTVTVPVGVDCPVVPATVTLTISLCKLVIVAIVGVAVTVAIAGPIGSATVTLADWLALVYEVALLVSGV